MKNVLLITSSPRGESSYSAQIATDLALKLGGELTVRELWRDALPAIDEAFVHAAYTPAEGRTPEQRAALATSDALISEIRKADTIVLAAGMINFGMPSALKTWIDLITRRGETFIYDETGPHGMLEGKKVILVLASGGVYSEGPMAAFNHLEPPLRTNLSFLGLTDIETVWIEGVNMGPEAAEEALKRARGRALEMAERAGQIMVAA